MFVETEVEGNFIASLYDSKIVWMVIELENLKDYTLMALYRKLVFQQKAKKKHRLRCKSSIILFIHFSFLSEENPNLRCLIAYLSIKIPYDLTFDVFFQRRTKINSRNQLKIFEVTISHDAWIITRKNLPCQNDPVVLAHWWCLWS